MFGRYGFGYPNTGQGNDLLAFQNRVIADGGEMILNAGEIASLLPLGDWSWFYVPGGRKAGVSYAQIPGSAGDLTMTRASVANENARNGTLTEVAANVGRLDFLSGVFQGQPIEPAATNLVFPSATATTQSRTVTAVAHTLSFFGTGSVTLSGAATGTLNGTGANNRVTLTFTPTAGSLTLTVAGSVTNWQLEAGTVATSLITTIGASATRQQDVLTRTSAGSLIGQSAGMVYLDLDLRNLGFAKSVISLQDTSYVGNAFRIETVGTNRWRVQIRAATVSVLDETITSPLITAGRYKIAFAYNTASNGVVLAVNGAIISTNTVSTMPTGVDRIILGTRLISGNFDLFLNDRIRAAGLSQRRWSNSELANLTRI